MARLAADLRNEFPAMKGFSLSNLKYMRQFAETWRDGTAIGQQPVGQLPWGHVIVLMQKLDDQALRDWYAAQALAHGWSRNVLGHHIATDAHARFGAAPTNFDRVLAPAETDLAQQITKDPYVLDFLRVDSDAAERDVEEAMVAQITHTLAELGPGFAFVGRQVHFEVDGDDFFIDLLFFHITQLRYIVIELKAGRFEPSFTGQLGFYVALVDDTLRTAAHAPSVGILLCTDKNEAVVRYALRGTAQPMAISTFTYGGLPDAEKNALPDAERLTSALSPLVARLADE